MGKEHSTLSRFSPSGEETPPPHATSFRDLRPIDSRPFSRNPKYGHGLYVATQQVKVTQCVGYPCPLVRMKKCAPVHSRRCSGVNVKLEVLGNSQFDIMLINSNFDCFSAWDKGVIMFDWDEQIEKDVAILVYHFSCFRISDISAQMHQAEAE